jgi:peptidoglycan/xylan/chitin deacetylase (PgdA/CDA1 family)
MAGFRLLANKKVRLAEAEIHPVWIYNKLTVSNKYHRLCAEDRKVIANMKQARKKQIEYAQATLMDSYESSLSPHRHTTVGITLLLFILHLGPLLLGWYLGWLWALGGLFTTSLFLIICSLYPHCRVFGSATRRFPYSTRSVILTIDDGPSADTEEILNLLRSYNVRALFFLIGSQAEQRPKDVKRIFDAGHIIGNHTQNHPCYWYWIYPPWRQRRELAQCQQTLFRITGAIPTQFRAPAGMRNPYCNLIAAEFGLAVTGWQARGFDGVDTPIEKIIATLRRGIAPGAIILIHQGMPHSLKVLKKLLEFLQEDGWDCVLPVEWLNAPKSDETPQANY